MATSWTRNSDFAFYPKGAYTAGGTQYISGTSPVADWTGSYGVIPPFYQDPNHVNPSFPNDGASNNPSSIDTSSIMRNAAVGAGSVFGPAGMLAGYMMPTSADSAKEATSKVFNIPTNLLVALAAILLLGVAAYSIILPESARGQIAVLGAKAALT